MKTQKKILAVLAGLAAMAAGAQDIKSVGTGPGPGVRYATDAYPGFDSEEKDISPERKEPRWFAWINGPNRDNAADQFIYCHQLLAEENWSKASKHLDALVREWPTSPEAPKAQQMLAENELLQRHDCVEAFAAYRYLLDFYSLQCDYNAIADKLYEVAGVMKVEGKEVAFVRFENVTDVRRAYEACVLRAPGAAWVPDAMLTIAELRVKEGKLGEAVKVLENLRNIHPDTRQARKAVYEEARVRMDILHEHGYNRSRCQDTVRFLKQAETCCDPDDSAQIRTWLYEAAALTEEEAYRGAKFYDSNTRTKRSAINAYEQFLRDYPASSHADEVRAKLEVLKAKENAAKENAGEKEKGEDEKK